MIETALRVLYDSFPFLVSIAGAVMYNRLPESRHKTATWVLICAGLIGSVITYEIHLRSDNAHAAEVTGIKKDNQSLLSNLNHVSAQNEQILHMLSSNRPQDEQSRRQRILEVLRNEYILSHQNVPTRIVTGQEWPPTDWLNERLAKMKEGWRVQKSADTPGLTQLATVLVELQKEQERQRQELTSRHLTPEQKRVIYAALVPFAGQSIQIGGLADDAETGRFAQEWVTLFKDAGWDSGQGSSMVVPPPEGLLIVVRDRRSLIPGREPPGLIAFIHALQQLGMIPPKAPTMFSNAVKAGQFELLVGSRPKP